MHTDVHSPTLRIRHFTFLISRLISYVPICNCGRISRYSAHLSSCNGTYLPQPSLHVPLSIEVFGYLKFVSTTCPLLRSIDAYSQMATYFAAEMSTRTDLHPTIISIRHLTFVRLPVIWAETATSCPSTTRTNQSVIRTPLVIYQHWPPPLSVVSVCDLYLTDARASLCDQYIRYIVLC